MATRTRCPSYRTFVALLVVAAGTCWADESAPPHPPYAVLATTGHGKPVDDTPNIDGLETELVAASGGHVAVVGYDILLQTDEQTVTRSCLFVSTGGKFVKRVTEGVPRPDGLKFVSLSQLLLPDINARGEVLFSASLSPDMPGVTPDNAYGWWVAGTDGVRTVARQGVPLIGLDGVIADAQSEGRLNDAGDVAFQARYEVTPQTPSVNPPIGVWRADDAGFNLLAISGDSAPGTDDATFYDVGFAALGPDGQVAVSGSLNHDGDNADGTRSTGLWSYGAGEATLVARAGDPMPGVPGQVFGYFNNATYNQVGDIAFVGLSSTIVTNGIFLAHDGDITPVVLSGDPAPGTDGGTFQSLGAELFVTDAGGVVFSGSVRGVASDANKGYWMVDGSGVYPLAIEGGDVPGVPGAVFFHNFDRQLTVNAAGEAIFAGEYFHPVTGVQTWAVFRWDPAAHESSLLVSVGDVFDVDDSPLAKDERVVSRIYFAWATTVANRRPSGLADDGRFYLRLAFADGSGAVVRFDLRGECLADFDHNGLVDNNDLLLFSKAVRVGLPIADLTGDGLVDAQDIKAFVAAYVAGCG